MTHQVAGQSLTLQHILKLTHQGQHLTAENVSGVEIGAGDIEIDVSAERIFLRSRCAYLPWSMIVLFGPCGRLS